MNVNNKNEIPKADGFYLGWAIIYKYSKLFEIICGSNQEGNYKLLLVCLRSNIRLTKCAASNYWTGFLSITMLIHPPLAAPGRVRPGAAKGGCINRKLFSTFFTSETTWKGRNADTGPFKSWCNKSTSSALGIPESLDGWRERGKGREGGKTGGMLSYESSTHTTEVNSC